MKIIIISVLLLLPLSAEEPKPPTAESLTADVKRLTTENASLKAQLEASVKTHMADAAACWTDDLHILNTRLEAVIAQKKAAALAKPEPVRPPASTDAQ